MRIEIRPLVRTRVARLRLVLAAAALVGASLIAGGRLSRAWETGLRRGAFDELPLPLLLFLSLSVGISAPAAFSGLAALAFAEESIDVGPAHVEIRTTAFERTRIRRFERGDLECWQETYRPLPPWWTWAVRRLAAKTRGGLIPLAAAVGPGEKRRIGIALARGTGKPLLAGRRRLEAGTRAAAKMTGSR